MISQIGKQAPKPACQFKVQITFLVWKTYFYRSLQWKSHPNNGHYAMKILTMVLSTLVFMSSAMANTSDDIISRYKEACGTECGDTIAYLSRYASAQCNIPYDSVVETSVELTGLQFVAISIAVQHPLAHSLQNYALKSLDCSDLHKWSKSIEDYSFVLEANNGLQGSNVSSSN